MEKFHNRYKQDPGFREFIEATNKDEVLFDFGYELWLKFRENTLEQAAYWVNPKIINITAIINYYEGCGEFERCQILTDIKNKL